MKVIFLDVDGVLNCARDYEVFMDGDGFFRINKILVERLQKIVDSTGCKLVLSSSWRKLQGGPEFVEQMGLTLYGSTDDMGKCRGEEIQRWLDIHPEVTQYVILDDDSDMLQHQLPNFVQTDFEHGLTVALAYRAKYKLLNGNRYD